jgi:hypothetical protein
MLSGSAKQLTSVVHTRTDRQRGKFGRVCCLLYNRTCPLFTVRVFWIRISPPTEFSCANLGSPGKKKRAGTRSNTPRFAPRFSGNQGQQRGGVTPAPRRTSKTEDEDQKGRDKSERPNARINTTTPPTRQKVCNVAPKRKQKRKDTDKTVQ